MLICKFSGLKCERAPSPTWLLLPVFFHKVSWSLSGFRSRLQRHISYTCHNSHQPAHRSRAAVPPSNKVSMVCVMQKGGPQASSSSSVSLKYSQDSPWINDHWVIATPDSVRRLSCAVVASNAPYFVKLEIIACPFKSQT